MTSNARKRSRLRGVYAITDLSLTPDTVLLERVGAVLAGGVALLQYRDKCGDGRARRWRAEALAALCRARGACFIVNDDVALAHACGADGVHLGADDTDPAAARAALGAEAIIGASCYDSLARAERAVRDGADYVAFGSFFASSIKPGAVRPPPALLARARARLDVPLCAIGGITAANGAALLCEGADMLAVISALFAAADPERAARELCALFA